MPSLPHVFAIADAMVDEAERKMPPAVRARLDVHLCIADGCLAPALPHHDLCGTHLDEVLAELDTWGYSRRLRGDEGAATVRDLLELVCVVTAAQCAGLAFGLLLV